MAFKTKCVQFVRHAVGTVRRRLPNQSATAELSLASRLFSSLQVRLTVLVVVLFLGSLWAFAMILGERQEKHMREIVEAEQLALASYAAEEIDSKIRLRIEILKSIAALLPPLLNDRERLAAFLQERKAVYNVFDFGLVVIEPDLSAALADYPTVPGRQADAWRLAPFLDAANSGATAIGQPRIDRFSRQPVVPIATPIKDPQGRLLAVLAGFTGIDAAYFLDPVSRSQPRQRAELLVVAPAVGMVVARSGRGRALQPMPPAGKFALFDRLLAGGEGSQIGLDERGEEQLASSRRIPSAGWLAVALMPTAQAFAPLRQQRSLIITAAAGLSLLMGALVAYLVRKALRPVVLLAAELESVTRGEAPLRPVTVIRRDEIGTFVESFNRAQEMLAREEMALRDSEEKLRTLIDAIPDSIQFKDQEGRWLAYNRQAQLAFGLEEVSCTGKSDAELAQLAPPQFRDALFRCRQTDEQTWQTGALSRREDVVPRPDGGQVVFDVIKVPLFDSDGSRRGMVIVGRDITETRRIQESLRESESRLKQSQHLAAVGHYSVDAASRTFSCSEVADEIHGVDATYPRDVEHWLQLLHPDDRGRMFALLEETLRDKQPLDREYRIRRPNDGDERWLHVIGQPELNRDGELVRYFGVVQDITERKQAELALQNSLHFSRQLIEVIPSPVFYKDQDGRYLGCNDAFERFTGMRREDIVGKTVYDITSGELAERYHAADQALFAHPGSQVYQASFHCGDGSLREVVFHKATFTRADGSIGGLVGVALDITERKQVEDALQHSLDEFNNLVTRIPVGVFKFRTRPDGSRQFDYVSPRWCEMSGLAADEVYGDSQVPFRRAHPEDLTDLLRNVDEAIRTLRPFKWEGRLQTGRGMRWLHIEASPTRLENGDVLWEGIQYDITERKLIEARLRLAASVFEHAHEGICITDADERILEVNPTFSDLTGYSREEALGNTPRMLKSGRQNADYYAAMWQSIDTEGYWRGEVWNRRRDGELYAELLTISAVRDEQGAVTHYVGVLSDITRLKEHEQQLERIAHYDALTSIPNRLLLADRMRQAIAQTQRTNKLMAVCYLDLDSFKPINDNFGHEAGDRLLVEMSERLQSCLRGGDTVARLGGDEFVLLLLGLERVEECETALPRILEVLSRPIRLNDHEVSISASIGVSLYPVHDTDPDTLLRDADQAMYRAKQEGKNRYRLFDGAGTRPEIH